MIHRLPRVSESAYSCGMPGAPLGPRLPRKSTLGRRSREMLEGAAYLIGVTVAVQRNRAGLSQGDLAAAIGVEQPQLSDIENGAPARFAPAKIDALFKRLDLTDLDGHAAFLKWWASNADKF